MKETFYRMSGVFEDGGTQTDGQMLELMNVPDRVASWLKKNPNLLTITIVRVTKEYKDKAHANNR